MTPQQIPTFPQTFRTIVTGRQNALAHNAALHVAKTPGTMYNPLYLSGGSGLGKTHLLCTIQAYLTPRLNGAEVNLVSSEAFAQDFLAHLWHGHSSTSAGAMAGRARCCSTDLPR